MYVAAAAYVCTVKLHEISVGVKSILCEVLRSRALDAHDPRDYGGRPLEVCPYLSTSAV